MRRSRLPEESESEVGSRALYGAAWSAEEARVGEEVAITAKAVGAEDGTTAMITIQQVTDEGLSDVEMLPPAEVSGGEIEATWTYKYEDESGEETDAAAQVSGSAPVLVAEILVASAPRTVQTPVLSYLDWYEVVAEDDENPIPGAKYRLEFPGGEIRMGEADDQGVIREENVPPGFPELHCWVE